MTHTDLRRETLAVLAGRPPVEPDGPLNAPIVLASALLAGGPSGYARDGSPGWAGFEDALGRLEGGHATAFASGMAAVSAVLHLVPPRAKVIAPSVVYMGVRDTLTERHEAGTLEVGWVDVSDTDAVLSRLADADVLWLESPTNPLLDVADLPALCAAAHDRGVLCVVDNTLATPLGQRPLEHGADLVVHSATKLIGGHSDLLMGAVVAGDEALARRVARVRELTGATPGALEAFLALRGLRTLPVRLDRAQATAAALAARLLDHPEVLAVRYPGLPDDPAHAIAAATLDGFGSMLTFRVRGGAARAEALAERVRVFAHATSFGGVESLLERRARYASERGIPADLLRVSVGCEHVDDLWADLEQALQASAGAVAGTTAAADATA
jgi:cystathionine gamma-synthase